MTKLNELEYHTLQEMIAERGNLLSLADLVELMKPFNLRLILQAIEWGSYHQGYVDSDAGRDKDILLPTEAMEELIRFSVSMGFVATVDGFVRYLRVSEKLPADEANLDEKAKFIVQTADANSVAIQNFMAECGNLLFLAIDREKVPYWKDPTLGWEDIIRVLDDTSSKVKLSNSTAEEQIIEASRCLAVGRGTACVLHLNNVLEMGLIWMRRKLPVRYAPGKKNEIDDWVSAINTYVSTNPPPSDAPRWRSIGGCCAAIRIAWRHPAAHADMIFTEESASEAYIAINGLMREIIQL